MCEYGQEECQSQWASVVEVEEEEEEEVEGVASTHMHVVWPYTLSRWLPLAACFQAQLLCCVCL